MATMTTLSVSVALLACVSALPAPESLHPAFWSQISQVLISPSSLHLAPAWSANITVQTGSSLGVGIGTYSRDTRKGWRAQVCAPNTLFRPDDLICEDQLAKNTSGPFNQNMTVGVGVGRVCKAFETPYHDMFSILKHATRTGSARVGDVPCSVWSFQSSYINISACVAADGVPRQFNMSTGQAYKATANQFWSFSNVSTTAPADAVFATSEVCEHKYPMPPCADGAVQPLDLYRVRSSGEPNVLGNRNLGDALGDMAFFCDLAGVDPTQVVTHWSVQANSSWGQYAYCLYTGGKNECHGSTGSSVGRESALGVEGAVQGQCSPNQLAGSWYSIPGDGECAKGAPIGTNGCTWSAHSLRSVSAGCILNDRGLKVACAAERSHAPMLKSTAIFKAALASSDPAQGGCPDAPEEMLVVML